MSKVTSLQTKYAATMAKHVHLTTDIASSIRYSLSNNYAEFDESDQSIVIGFYGFVHLSNNPDADFEMLMNSLDSEFNWSSLNGIVIYDLKTKLLDVEFFLDDYWLCGENSDSDPTEPQFIELNPSLYKDELKSHGESELADDELYDLIKNSQLALQHAL